ncbi:glycosyl hydrolase [Alkalicoccobacillus murimartini]|uniref:Glycosyl hydrolases family 2 sugar binding domain-containing protein n=1 Tax=Alkalicoccobacillus murimartini TaxID=171685 RepID=A0ABT9YIW3_9BACI|nr:glycosyl hydrolase [Alkalicoccobacillus murimartini]MDQ0207656.1 hypothetical protein [Alkalicoccobacillus murimartini]
MHSLREQFLNPSTEYTPVPFWFWNDRLTHTEIKRQIHAFCEKGVEGFVIHPRLGLPSDIEYLSEEFMAYVKTAVSEASCLSMSVMLYDEAMYPSGSAHGRVVKDQPAYASRGLQMVRLEPNASLTLSADERLISLQAISLKNDVELLSLDDLNEGRFHDRAIFAFIEKPSKGTIRGVHAGEDDGEAGAPASADLLNPLAVESFIHHTHEVYKQYVGKWMGTTITAFFTDEPDILGRNASEGLKPWTEGFLQDFLRHGGKEEQLSALWLDTGEQTEQIRHTYERAVNQRLSTVYYLKLAEWCESHSLALTGHPAASTDIGLLKHFHIPGQDVVWRWVGPEENKAIEGPHSTAAKCGADAARHYGRRRNLNEFLGVCSKDGDWTLTADDMKWYIDWLAVRGVNLFCPHAFYYSVSGKERSHERPPDVGMHNSWWPFYNQFSTYMKRLSWLMTDSVNQTSVAVLCTENVMPSNSIKFLYQQQMEFNYLEEDLLEQAIIKNGTLSICEQTYRTVLVDKELQLKKETRALLKKFEEQGGQIIEGHTFDQVEKTMELNPAESGIRVTHVKKQGQSFYFLVNEGETAFSGACTIPDAPSLHVWNAWTGELCARQMERDGSFILHLGRRESVILLPAEHVDEGNRIHSKTVEQQRKPVTDWSMHCDGEKLSQKPLSSWVTWEEHWTHFSGTVRYEANVYLSKGESKALKKLDAGEVSELAELWINDVHIGSKLWAPYQITIPESVLVEGTNKIVLEVTNSKANEMDGLSRRSGLMGPVVLSND